MGLGWDRLLDEIATSNQCFETQVSFRVSEVLHADFPYRPQPFFCWIGSVWFGEELVSLSSLNNSIWSRFWCPCQSHRLPGFVFGRNIFSGTFFQLWNQSRWRIMVGTLIVSLLGGSSQSDPVVSPIYKPFSWRFGRGPTSLLFKGTKTNHGYRPRIQVMGSKYTLCFFFVAWKQWETRAIEDMGSQSHNYKVPGPSLWGDLLQ